MIVYLGVSNFMMNFHTELGVYIPADSFNRVLGGKWRVQSMNRHMEEITELPSRSDVSAGHSGRSGCPEQCGGPCTASPATLPF